MGNKGYVSLEQSAHRLGRPTSYVKLLICEGKLECRLVGKEWLVTLPALEKLQASLPEQPRPGVHKKKRLEIARERSCVRGAATSTRRRPVGTPNVEDMDARVRELTSAIQAHLANVQGGKAIWNRIRQDRYGSRPPEGRGYPGR